MKVITNKGLEFECNFYGLSSTGYQYIDIPNITMLDAMMVFGEEEQTEVLTFSSPAETVIRYGYTQLIGIQTTASGDMRITLIRPVEGEG